MMFTLSKTKLVGLLIGSTAIAVALGGCTQVRRPVAEPYLATTSPPAKQEFRWSNGKLPKTIDPARAAAAPETDVARALFEGLTTLDPKTLEAVPAVAEKFISSADKKTWTFHLRKNARWSNGRRVTANDFVASWKRVRDLGEKAAHFELTKNIVGFNTVSSANATVSIGPPHQLAASPHAETTDEPVKPAAPLGVKAIDEYTLEVSLEYADADLPKLVADTAFRPVFGDGADVAGDEINKTAVTNGPFRLGSVSKEALVLARSDTYWNKSEVKPDAVRFVPTDNAEAALDAYKRGDVDAVTNAAFEPLALKLMTPYDDFRRTPHSALNFYEFNLNRAPFNDRRVRAALSNAIDRTKLAEVELEGAAVPADRILPFGEGGERLVTDVETAKSLLETAGYANGSGFPVLRLVINRNDLQQRLARAVARMWRENLNLETEIIVKETAEMDGVRASGDFDLIRRNVVLPSADEFAGLTAVFGSALRPVILADIPTEDQRQGPSATDAAEPPVEPRFEPVTEADLLYESRVIPLYFPVSYSLVRPYVTGFETNAIDAVELNNVAIDSNWQPAAR